MKLGCDYRVSLYHNAWRKASLDLGLEPEATVAKVEALAVRTADAFAAAASRDDIVTLKRDLPVRLIDLVADRATRCLQVLKVK